MRLTVVIHLLLDGTRAYILLDTIGPVNAACALVSNVAWQQNAFGRRPLHAMELIWLCRNVARISLGF